MALYTISNDDLMNADPIQANFSDLDTRTAALESQIANVASNALLYDNGVFPDQLAASQVGTTLVYSAGGYIHNHVYYYTTTISVDFLGLAAGTYYVELDKEDVNTYSSTSSDRTNLNTVVWNGAGFTSVTTADRYELTCDQEIIDARSTFDSLDLRLDDIEDDVDNLETDMTTAQGDITDIKGAKALVLETTAGFSGEVVTPTLNLENKAINGSFEYWYHGTSNVCPEGYEKIGTPTDVSRDTGERDGYGGAYAVKITSNGTGNEGMKLTLSDLKASTLYKVSIRVKATSGDTAKVWTTGGSVNMSETETSTTWEDVVGTFTTDTTPTNIVLNLGSENATDIVWFDELVIYEGQGYWEYAPNPLDELYKQQTLYINGSSMHWSTSGVPNVDMIDGWAHTINDDVGYLFPIPYKVQDKVVVIDQITLSVNTVSAVASEDYITLVRLGANDLDGTTTSKVEYTTDIGNGSSGDVSTDLMTTPYEMVAYPHFIRIDIEGTDAVTDVKIRGIKIVWHVKAHE